jgi:predicted RNA-binding protein YlxR (DUF448 family)
MCLGCRERFAQDELIRIQVTNGKLILVEHKASHRSGRSVYFCPKVGCLDKTLRQGEIAFKRAKYDKIIVRLNGRQVERLRFAFTHAARRLRARLGVGPTD